MNRLLLMGLLSYCLLILAGCHLGDDHKKSHSDTPKIIVPDSGEDDKDEDEGSDDNGDATDIVNCEANPGNINEFVRVQTTYGLLYEGAFLAGESGGLLPLTITTPVAAGETVISVDSTVGLISGQLLTYLSTDDKYSVGKVASLTTNTITLVDPLLHDLAANSSSLWNFYDDASHANEAGFRALADFGFNTAYSVLEPNKVHLLLGDSWFRRNGETPFESRLLQRLPFGSVIQNEGIGGHSLCGLLGRVDNAITTHNPDYVWINSSINDFFDGVTQEQYKDRMQTLIGKIQTAGAIAIVMDPAPGPLNQSTDDGTTFTTLSRRYASQILNLLAETQVPE